MTASHRSVVAHLNADECAAVLGDLLAERADLSADVERLAMGRLQRQDAEVVANEVARNLQRIPLEALAARAGRRRGGYVHETDAAWALLEETVQPYVDDLQRRAR